MREAAASRSDNPVTIGSYYRTVQQARRNMRQSMLTILIGLWVGLIKVEDARKLFDLMAKGAGQVPEEDDRFVAVLEALLDRMML